MDSKPILLPEKKTKQFTVLKFGIVIENANIPLGVKVYLQ